MRAFVINKRLLPFGMKVKFRFVTIDIIVQVNNTFQQPAIVRLYFCLILLSFMDCQVEMKYLLCNVKNMLQLNYRS